MLSAASFSPTTFCEASIPVALLHLFSCNCFSPAVDAEISRSRWSAPWIHVFLPLLLRNIVFHRGLHPPRRVAFLICDSLSAFFLWQWQRLGEIKRESCHIFTTPVPRDLARCRCNNTITILADRSLKFHSYQPERQQEYFHCTLEKWKGENSEHNSVSWHLKKGPGPQEKHHPALTGESNSDNNCWLAKPWNDAPENPTISSTNEIISLHQFTASLLEVEENSQRLSTWNIVFLTVANGQSEDTHGV